MLRRFRSFRVKLILYFTAVFGMVQIMLTLTGLALREQYIRDFYDEQVIERMAALTEKIQATPAAVSSDLLTALVDHLPRSASFREYHATVRLMDDGAVLARTASLGDIDLPFSDAIADRVRTRGSDVRMISGSVLRDDWGGATYRLMTRRLPSIKGRSMVLAVATNYEAVDRSVNAQRWFFYAALPLGLLAAATTSWLVTGKLSYRINRVANLARELTPDDLTQRLGEPIADDEVADLVRNINRMLDRLQAGYEAQERFIHDASHELKTPLAAMLTEAQVVKMTGYTHDDCRAFLDSALHELMHMSRLIESLLLLTRVGKDNPRETFEDCDVNDLVIDAVRRCGPLSEEYGVAVKVSALEAPEGCGDRMVRCDRELIVIMVSNLIRNAIRFTPRGGDVRVSTRLASDDLAIEVADDGPGIADEDLPHVFDRFFQGRQKSPRRGTGLGLAIADAVAKVHGGHIEVANRTPHGAVFTIVLPFGT